MTSTRATPPRTRKDSKPEDFEDPQLEDVINLDRNKNKDNGKVKEEAWEAAGNKSADRGANEPAIMLGEIVWKKLLQEEDELEGTNFMYWLEKELGMDDYKKVKRDKKKALLDRKEEFY